MPEVNLGNFANSPFRTKDAIHVPVVALVAAVPLIAGQRVKLVLGSDYRIEPANEGHCIGIVDPFLPDEAGAHRTVWVMLMPGSITGLRHDWEHPDLPSTDEEDYDDGCRGCY